MLYAYARYEKSDTGEAVRQAIFDYVRKQNLEIDKWLSAASLTAGLKKLRPRDMLLVSELCCLGKSLRSIKKIISECISRKITLVIVCDNYVFDDTPASQMLLSAIDMVLVMSSRLKSQIMRNRLCQLRGEGKIFGRPPGSRNKKIKLSSHEREIEEMLAQKISKAEIARRLGVNRMTLYAFLRRMPK